MLTEHDVVVAESLSQAVAERDDALRRADALEKRLGALEKESQAALDQAKAEAQEREDKRRAEAADREDKLEGRLRTLAEALSGKIFCHGFFTFLLGPRKLNFSFCCAGAIGAPLDLKDRVRVDSLTDAVAAVEGCSAQVQGLLAKVKEVLERFHESVLPKAGVPQTLGELVEVFCADEDPLVGYSRAQTRTGAEAMLTLAMGHGIEGDFQKATSSFPTGADGKEVDLHPFAKRAKKLGKQLAALLEKRFAESSAAAKAETAKPSKDAA